MLSREFVEGLAFHAEMSPNRPAIITLDAVVSYGSLWAGAKSLASRINALATPGARIGLVIPNPIGHMTAICALHLAGFASLSLDPPQLAGLQPGIRRPSADQHRCRRTALPDRAHRR